MKKLSIINFCAVVLALTSCTSYQYTARQTQIVRQDIQTTPTVVDVRPDYNKRITVTSGWNSSKEDAMNECRYLAITENNIDIVVDPIFKIEYISNKRNGYRATLTGFAGYYMNPRSFFEDIEATKKYTREDIEKYLLLHNPEIIRYLNDKEGVVNIYHTESHSSENKPEPPALNPAPKKDTKQPAKRK